MAFAERHNKTITENGIVYINIDEGVSGPHLYAGASPSLNSLIRNVSTQIIDPIKKIPISQIWNGEISVLGSGSDYTSFIDHFGIPSIDLNYHGDFGVYHSVYDSIHWMVLFLSFLFIYFFSLLFLFYFFKLF